MCSICDVWKTYCCSVLFIGVRDSDGDGVVEVDVMRMYVSVVRSSIKGTHFSAEEEGPFTDI